MIIRMKIVMVMLKSQGRDLFMRMLEVFVLKFKTIADTQLPYLLNKWYLMSHHSDL